jgi:enediyne biosynthesis protein E3
MPVTRWILPGPAASAILVRPDDVPEERHMQPTMTGAIRLRIFAPDPRDVTFSRRGFHSPGAEQQANLEKVGSMFLEGFGYGMGGRALPDIESSLETVDKQFRGFAYEGCTMALAVRDAIRPAGRHWVHDFLAGPAAPHVYMAHIGIGWAMARLPSVRWRAIMPEDEVLRWLALDGYGFHQAYFKTGKYVTGQYQSRLPVWQPSDYASRAVDQGIGRALWFVNGSDVRRLAGMIGSFAPARRADLWSGAALASVYAGGADAGDIKLMRELAGEYRPDAAQGAAFAAKARLLAGLVTPHTETAVRVYCAMSVEEAAAVTEEAIAVLLEPPGPIPGYELWRQQIRKQFE